MSDQPAIEGISHIAICVRNLERTLAFYRDLVGLRVDKDEIQPTESGGLPHVYQQPRKTRRVVYLRYGDGPTTPFLVFTEHPGETVSGEAIMLDQVGISHFSFTVPNVEDLTRRLLAAGAETRGPADSFRDADGRIRTVFFRDPDGMLVQFDQIRG